MHVDIATEVSVFVGTKEPHNEARYPLGGPPGMLTVSVTTSIAFSVVSFRESDTFESDN